MTPSSPAPPFNHADPGCLGVLLINLGTPEAPTAPAIRRYLREFLWDRRVVELPRPLWWLILNGFVLPFRPARLAPAYQRIWTDQGSPLLAISRRQRNALQDALASRLSGPFRVVLGMRYGQPSIPQALRELQAASVRRLLVLPLYPQYSATTTATAFDALAAELGRWRWIPALRWVQHYPDHPGYLAALAESVRRFQAQHGVPERLLMSFHGLPRRTLAAGDPYFCDCHKTARLLAAALDLPSDRWALSFQSRFGREEWLRPYTDETLRDWPQAGIKRVQVICPGFSADCLETLEEVAIHNRTLFLAAGGEDYQAIPCLNDHPAHIQALADLVIQETQGWPETAPIIPSDKPDTCPAECQRRAMAAGAP
ncbi:MAG: ferrochelatase [Pseudomonadota bacterium]